MILRLAALLSGTSVTTDLDHKHSRRQRVGINLCVRSFMTILFKLSGSVSFVIVSFLLLSALR